jgi:hypothetical protein
MPPSALQGLKAGLREFPLTRRLYATLKHYQLCRRPYRGAPVEVQQRLEGLNALIGRDRLPFGTRIPLLTDWLTDLNRLAPDAPPDPRRILFFSALPYWVQYNLPVAVVLAARGALVDFVWLPYEGMDENDAPTSPGRMRRSRLAKRFPFVTLHPRLRLCNLRHVHRGEPNSALRQLASRYARVDCQHWLRRELLDYDGDQRARRFLEFRTTRNLDCLVRLQSLLRRRRYDSFLIPNGGVYEFGMAYELARLSGIRPVTFDFTERQQMILASYGAPAVESDTTELWRVDEPHELTPERAERVRRFLWRREKPDWQEGGYTWPGQIAAVAGADRLWSELRLAPGKPTALLCTNLAYDAAVLGHTRTFSSMIEWMLETVAWFRQRPDWQLIVRCHPAEAHHAPGEPAAEIIAARFPKLPDTIRVIKPTDKVNTYGLMPLIRLGLVYTTTTGLEMATRGIPVIVAGQVHYLGKGFTTDPTSPADYFAALERLTSANAPRRLSEREVELALCYAEVYFERWPRPFPWFNPGNLDRDLGNWPVQRILAEDCPPAFLQTFDYLSGRAS